MTYEVVVQGCDGSTEIQREFSAEQLAFVTALIEEINRASEYGCQPTMRIREMCPSRELESEAICGRDIGHDGDHLQEINDEWVSWP